MSNPKNSQESEYTELGELDRVLPFAASVEDEYTATALGDSDTDTTGLRIRSVQTRLSAGEWCQALALTGLTGHTSLAEYLRHLIREDAKRHNLGPVPTTPEARQRLLVRLLERDRSRPGGAKNGGK